MQPVCLKQKLIPCPIVFVKLLGIVMHLQIHPYTKSIRTVILVSSIKVRFREHQSLCHTAPETDKCGRQHNYVLVKEASSIVLVTMVIALVDGVFFLINIGSKTVQNVMFVIMLEPILIRIVVI